MKAVTIRVIQSAKAIGKGKSASGATSQAIQGGSMIGHHMMLATPPRACHSWRWTLRSYRWFQPACNPMRDQR